MVSLQHAYDPPFGSQRLREITKERARVPKNAVSEDKADAAVAFGQLQDLVKGVEAERGIILGRLSTRPDYREGKGRSES